MKAKKLVVSMLSAAMALGTMAVPVFAADEAAKIGDTKYATYESAVDNVTAGQTVTLLKDVTYDTEHEVAVQSKAFNLNLGGKTFTTNSTQSTTLGNNGYKAAAICYSINTGAAVSISNGTIKTAYGAGVYIDDPMTATLTGLTIDAGTVGTQSTAEYSSAIRVTGGADVIINSGNYKGSGYSLAVSNSGGNVTINGGTFHNDIFFSVNTDSGKTKSITINGGIFKGNFVNPTSGTITIKGGTFTNDPSAYVPEQGYTTIKNPDGTWTVGTPDFCALQNQLNKGGDVTLDANIDLGNSYLTVPAGVTVTLDLNGRTIKSDVDNGTKAASGNWDYIGTINNEGNLTITGSGNVNATKGTAVRNTSNGTLTIESGNFYSKEFAAFNNFGTATVNGGTYVSDSAYGAAYHAPDNIDSKHKYAFCNEAGTLTVHDADVSGVHGGMGFNAGNVTVNDATVSATNFYALYVAGERDTVQAVINGGTFTSDGYNTIYVGNDAEGDGGNRRPASCQINGGNFDKGIYAGTNTGNPSISAGKFGAKPDSNYVAKGSIVLSTDDTTYKYEVKTVKEATPDELLTVLATGSTTSSTATITSKPVGGTYEQISAAQVTGETSDEFNKTFKVTTTTKGTTTVTLNRITDETVFSNATILCGLIIKNIPETETVTVEIQ